MKSRPLLESVSGLLRRTYRISDEVPSPTPFVIGDRGLQKFYSGPHGTRILGVGSGPACGDGARTLVRETQDGIRAAIYLPDDMIRTLEVAPPQHGVHERNVDSFATLVEEVDHFLCIAHRAVQERPITLFELELHANVSKRLVLARFLASRTGKLSEARRVWLDWHLFHKAVWNDPDAQVRQRYVDAVRWALRFLRAASKLGRQERICALRRFHEAQAEGKLRLIRTMAA